MAILIYIVVLVAFVVSIRVSNAAIKNYGAANKVNAYRVKYISKTINIGIITFFLIIFINISGFEYSQISIFLSSVFAVIGVALFAQWSILSNITASLIIFFGFPYRVGDKVKVLDKDDDISGIIEEISMFHVLIRRGEELITYPNSLILQKAVVKNPKTMAVVDAGTDVLVSGDTVQKVSDS